MDSSFPPESPTHFRAPYSPVTCLLLEVPHLALDDQQHHTTDYLLPLSTQVGNIMLINGDDRGATARDSTEPDRRASQASSARPGSSAAQEHGGSARATTARSTEADYYRHFPRDAMVVPPWQSPAGYPMDGYPMNQRASTGPDLSCNFAYPPGSNPYANRSARHEDYNPDLPVNFVYPPGSNPYAPARGNPYASRSARHEDSNEEHSYPPLPPLGPVLSRMCPYYYEYKYGSREAAAAHIYGPPPAVDPKLAKPVVANGSSHRLRQPSRPRAQYPPHHSTARLPSSGASDTPPPMGQVGRHEPPPRKAPADARPLRAPAFASASYAEEFNAGEQHTGHREWVATVKCPYCEAEFCPPTLDGLETVICSNCQCECNKRGVLVCVDCWNTAEAARAREEIRQQELEQAQQQRKAIRDRLYAMGNTGHMG